MANGINSTFGNAWGKLIERAFSQGTVTTSTTATANSSTLAKRKTRTSSTASATRGGLLYDKNKKKTKLGN